MACGGSNVSPKNNCTKKSTPLKWLKVHQKRPSVVNPLVKKSPTHPELKYDSLLKIQIATVVSSVSNPVSNASEEFKTKWRPKFLKFLRSPKVTPSDSQCPSLAINEEGSLPASPESSGPAIPDTAIDQADGPATSGLHLALSGEASPMSTTAHLLSLLDPEDIKNFHVRTNSYEEREQTKMGLIGQMVSNQWQNTPVFTFQTGGHNGNKLIEEILQAKGWIHLPNAAVSDVKCLWMESLIQFSIWGFKEGYQMLNHIPNTHLLSNKLCLLRCLQEYNALSKRGLGLRMVEFLPETYRLDLKQDRIQYCEQHKAGQLWICKPAMLNQGKGIFLVKNSDELLSQLKHLEAEELSRNHFSKPANVRIIQRYIENPLLLEGRKADIRAYMLIASTKPFVVLFHEGYVRLSCSQYDPSSSDLLTHLTNQCMQRRNPQYESMKEETVWDMPRLLDYISYHVLPGHPLENTFVCTTFRNQMCRIMLHCFHAVKSKLDRRIGLFELLGFDFLIDCALKVWLLEINVNPSLQVNCQVLKRTIPSVLGESVDVSHECFEKSRQGLRILPLQSKKNFVLLYCEQMPYMKTIPKPVPLPRKRNSTGSTQVVDNKEQRIKSPSNSDLQSLSKPNEEDV